MCQTRAYVLEDFGLRGEKQAALRVEGQTIGDPDQRCGSHHGPKFRDYKHFLEAGWAIPTEVVLAGFGNGDGHVWFYLPGSTTVPTFTVRGFAGYRSSPIAISPFS
jgi:hypothetical protein